MLFQVIAPAKRESAQEKNRFDLAGKVGKNLGELTA
jgi:hypothetical protein